jgi:hypothetical protein
LVRVVADHQYEEKRSENNTKRTLSST